MLYHASLIVPITSTPITDGAILVNGSKIADLGTFQQLKSLYPNQEITHLPGQALLPGFVNSHTHLDLSALAGKIPAGMNFIPWLYQIIAFRRGWDKRQKLDSIQEGIERHIRQGITTVGDISGDGSSARLIRKSGIGGIVFWEILGFNPAASGQPLTKKILIKLWQAQARLKQNLWRIRHNSPVHPGISPHAPYSTSIDLYKRAYALAQKNHWRLTTHLAETEHELTFLKSGGGEFGKLLEEQGAWNPDWQPPDCSPVKYLAKMGILGPNVLAVHLNYLEPGDIELMATHGVHAVTCPGSNRWFGRKNIWIKQMLDNGINVCLGTDSLASNFDLSMLQEMRYIHQDYPNLPPEQILNMATLNGAKALGSERLVGSVEPGKLADIIGLAIPPGIRADQISQYIVEQTPKVLMVMARGKILRSFDKYIPPIG